MRQQPSRHDETPIADPNTGKAIVHIYAPNYGGTSVCPMPAVFASVQVHDSHYCGFEYHADGGCLDGEFFWQ